ncbi:hypothetical protein [Streptomyces sp. NPDC050355]|uniref:hypothetical protein n=1 Tax=Streptomyces sp. NPDC050355 TaxID=3365609 RepID=UPI0037A80268
MESEPLGPRRTAEGRHETPEERADRRWVELLLLATVASALLLILRVAMDDTAVPWIVAGLAAWFMVCWFALPWALRRYTRTAPKK